MNTENGFNTTYTGTRNFAQINVASANATGFGAAADDFSERGIDLNEQLVRNKPATFFFKMIGDAMKGAGIFCGDMLVVDRSVADKNGKVVIAVVDDEMQVRRYRSWPDRLIAETGNQILVNADLPANFKIWGVVVYSIHTI